MDLRYAFRSLAKNPGFSVLAIVVLALGMGANTAIFSVVNGLFLKPLPYPEPERIVNVYSKWTKSGRLGNVSGPDFQDWKNAATSFEALAAYGGDETSVAFNGSVEYAGVKLVSRGFFDVFRLRPLRGRVFSAEEEKPGAASVAIVSESYWRRRMNGEPLDKKSLRIGGKAYQVIGVIAMQYPDKTDVWISTGGQETAQNRTAHNFLAVGRLKTGISPEQANTELAAIAGRIAAQYPKDNAGKSSAAVPLQEDLVSNVRLTVLLLFAAVGLVVLIACANVANLLLSKATARAREIAIRAAVGASRWDIVQLMLAESLVLAVAAAALGLLLAYWGLDALLAAAPKDLPRINEVHIDATVMAFTFLTSIASTLIFGLAPAVTASKADLNETLKQTSRTTSGSAAGLRSALVIGEIALSVMLAIGAGLLVKSLATLNNVPLGFSPEKILTAETTVAADDIASARLNARFYTDALPRIQAIPGVIAAGAATAPPGNASHSNGSIQVEGRLETDKQPEGLFTVATPGYLRAIGIPLRAGRDFDDRDTADGVFNVIVNEAFVKAAYPAGEYPLGKRIRCGYDSDKWMTITGIVGDIRQRGPARRIMPELIMPYLQHPVPATYMALTIRTQGDPALAQESIRAVVREVNSEVPLRFSTIETAIADGTAQPRFRTWLLALLAGLAVLLAMIGVYGVMAYNVSQRLGEIGLRMALGASRGDVVRLVLSNAARLAAIGLIAGLAGAFAAGRVLESMLFQVKAYDPQTFMVVAIGSLLAVAAATFLPARRAAALDPAIVLRES